MGIAVIPAPSASGKTAYRTTLTSGTSWTVPAGVTFVNVTLVGGGGGGGCVSDGYNGTTPVNGATGGTTTFTGATSASGGNGANYFKNDSSIGGNYQNGTSSNNFGEGGKGAKGSANLNSSTYAAAFVGADGANGQVISSTLSVTPGASISYSIGAGGSGGNPNANRGSNGGSGAQGKIDIEYWV